MLLQKLIEIKVKPKMSIIFLSLLLTACSKDSNYKRQPNGDEAYLDAPRLKSLKSPESLMLPLKNGHFYVPDVTEKGIVGKKVDIRPPVQILTLLDASRGEYTNGISTLLLENSRVALWPEVLNVIKQKNLPVAKQQDIDQTLTTDSIAWNHMDGEPPFSGRYKISVKQKERQKLLIVKTLDLHQGDKKITDPNDIQRYNNTVLNTIIEGLYQVQMDAENASVTRKAGRLDVQSGSDDSGLPNIVIRAPYETVWERLPSALKKTGITVKSSRRSEGSLSVTYKALTDDQWKQMGIKKPDLKPADYKLQLGDLGNRSSLQFLDASGQTLIQSQNDTLVSMLKVAFSETEIKK